MDGPAPIARRHGVDPTQFERFYREHFAMAWRGLVRLGVSRDDCEDAAQEVFVTAHRRWLAFDGAVPRHAWLLGIIRRIAWRWRRTDRRRQRRHEALAHAPREPDDGLDARLARADAGRLLAQFLAHLDDARREVFVLGELESLGRVELGAALGINPNTAYSRLQSVRRSFFAHFAALDDDACARIIVGAERDDAPDEVIAVRGWAMLLPALGEPTLALASTGLGSMIASHGMAIGLALAVVIAGGAVIAASRPTTPEPVAVVAPPPAPIVAVPAELPATPPLLDATPSTAPTPPSATVVQPRAVVVPVPTRSTLDAELELLHAARTASLAGDTVTARRRLAEHAIRYGDATTLADLRAAITRDLDARSISAPRSGDEPVEE